MGPQIISLRGGIPFLPGPLERSSTVFSDIALQLYSMSHWAIPGDCLRNFNIFQTISERWEEGGGGEGKGVGRGSILNGMDSLWIKHRTHSTDLAQLRTKSLNGWEPEDNAFCHTVTSVNMTLLLYQLNYKGNPFVHRSVMLLSKLLNIFDQSFTSSVHQHCLALHRNVTIVRTFIKRQSKTIFDWAGFEGIKFFYRKNMVSFDGSQKMHQKLLNVWVLFWMPH